jgi:hypothetical protein
MLAINTHDDRLVCDLSERIHRLDHYLLSPAVCCPETGAVFAVRGSTADYAYPEIAGYYLTYLAGLAIDAPALSKRRFAEQAQRVVAWLRLICAEGLPLTRYYLDDDTQDWRNDFVFIFDLAMVLRGLAHARELDLADWSAPTLADHLQCQLAAADGRLRAVQARGLKAATAGWSARFDAYQLKSAAGMARFARHFSHSGLSELAEEARALFCHTPALEFDHLPLHPRFYALEGVAQLQGVAAYPAISHAVFQAMGEASPDWQRIDVLAQALRLGCACSPAHPLNHELASTLAALVVDNTGLGFCCDTGDPQRNTWTTLFARQALAYYQQAKNGGAIDVQFLI